MFAFHTEIDVLGDYQWDKVFTIPEGAKELADENARKIQTGGGVNQHVLVAVVPSRAEYGNKSYQAIRKQQVQYFEQVIKVKNPLLTVSSRVVSRPVDFRTAVLDAAPVNNIVVLGQVDNDGKLEFSTGAHVDPNQLVYLTDVPHTVAEKRDVKYVHFFAKSTSDKETGEGEKHAWAPADTHKGDHTTHRRVAYNIPRQLVDGQTGWVHSALNPEVLSIAAVAEYIQEYETSLDLAAEAERKYYNEHRKTELRGYRDATAIGPLNPGPHVAPVGLRNSIRERATKHAGEIQQSYLVKQAQHEFVSALRKKQYAEQHINSCKKTQGHKYNAWNDLYGNLYTKAY